MSCTKEGKKLINHYYTLSAAGLFIGKVSTTTTWLNTLSGLRKTQIQDEAAWYVCTLFESIPPHP